MSAPPRSHWPVAVIGGGIAGCAAALTLAQQGIAVAWIAPETVFEDKPGESLAAAALPLLDELGLGALLADPAHRQSQASYTSWGSDALLERHAAAQPGGLGHVIDRPRFEASLIAETAALADITRLRDTVLTVQRQPGAWTLSTASGATLSADLVIDATGRKSLLGRAQARQKRVDRLVAAYAFLSQVETDIDPTPATIIEAVSGGWWYATLLADRRLALNFYSDPDLLPRRIGQRPDLWQALVADTRYISQWVESAGYALSGPPGLASAGTVWLEQAAGSDWLAVGDAAISFDPLSAHGMTTALWTGVEAAKAAAKAIGGDHDALADYATRLRLGVEHYLGERRSIYARERRFTSHPFWQRRLHDADLADRTAT
ncbi:glycine oxidase maturase GoxB [Devosia sp. 63-57]|uniref:glycine oxidase maturase GoxB n=1 Tax=Devosia sp. 63-57 TaxID=1895751 RepID=UPI00086E1CC9|nr:glycine oxidase maturase GoxB [Devosia sp. 63-57]ODT50547.1 MAG: hypothetical protein ABS74_03260 [Pelagibacterium sp. SCN 63-126]ODU88630.1 MAG: hypothetical protein ABT14_02855 [Pelagibacterium sp. SCN 63-17]OJX45503.1 MAG: hypothetical protein BGO80_06785 [Devosia sp. 63-57]